MKYDYDVVIIGVGSGGMIAGEVAAKMGVKAALVERHRVGGDCLWDRVRSQQGASCQREGGAHNPPR